MNYDIILMIIVGFIPLFVVNFERYISRKDYRLRKFKTNFVCSKSDYIFIPFNLFAFWAINIELYLLLVIVVVSLLMNIIVHIYWSKSSDPGFMFNKKRKLIWAGYIHFIYSVFQTAFIAVFLFSNIENIQALAASLILIIFSLMIVYGSKKTHKEYLGFDVTIGLLIFAGALFKLYTILAS